VLRRLTAAALAATFILPLAACGGGDDDDQMTTFPPPSIEQWQARVDGFCSDGIQEAVALPLPRSTKELPDDARGRAEILVTVRDAVLPLPRPEGTEDAVDAWLEELTADAELLNEIASVAAADDDYLDLIAELDESSAGPAAELGLDTCVTLAQAIARTP
jgi:hypothetical protein